jgi:hypothetical protein
MGLGSLIIPSLVGVLIAAQETRQWWASRPMGELAERVVTSMRDEPHQWEDGQHAVTHLKAGLCIWTANGSGHVDLYQDGKTTKCFSGREKKAIWRAYKAFALGRKRARTAKAASDALTKLREHQP